MSFKILMRESVPFIRPSVRPFPPPPLDVTLQVPPRGFYKASVPLEADAQPPKPPRPRASGYQ
jgi:hypothetical protein